MTIPRDPNHPGFPIHPGEMLREEFMVPYGLSAESLAVALRVSSIDISELIAERGHITADLAYRLARYFSMSARFWMNLQSNYELAIAYKTTQTIINKEVQPRIPEIA